MQKDQRSLAPRGGCEPRVSNRLGLVTPPIEICGLYLENAGKVSRSKDVSDRRVVQSLHRYVAGCSVELSMLWPVGKSANLEILGG
eukprot:1482546-Rhodomonas_salina.1